MISPITRQNSFFTLQIKNTYDIIDLTLLDLNMPEVHGLEFLESIRNDKLLAKIPVIIQSGCVNEVYIIPA